MPGWGQVVDRLQGNTDRERLSALKRLAKYTGRETIAYYSGWQQKSQAGDDAVAVVDRDVNGFMACLKGAKKSAGLDLILHTPGGAISAAQLIMSYLRSMFDTNIRVIVPQQAMSAGTMMACAASSIVMGKHSSLGPFDPAINGLSTFAVINEFQMARDEIIASPGAAGVWAPILAQYEPGFIVQCGQTITHAHNIVGHWLQSGMFAKEPRPGALAKTVVDRLGNANVMNVHDHQVNAADAKALGLVIEDLEADPELQDLVLTLHHHCIYALSSTRLVKLTEGSRNVSYNIMTGDPR